MLSVIGRIRLPRPAASTIAVTGVLMRSYAALIGRAGGEGGMAQIVLDEPPDPWDVLKVLRLAVALPQAREDADDLAVALRPEHGVGRHELRAVDTGKACEVALEHRRGERRWNIAPRILEQRDDIVARRSDDGVLEIEQAASGDRLPLRQEEKIVDVVVAQDEGGRRAAHGERQDPPPCREIVLARPDRHRRFGGGEKPIDEQRRLVEKTRLVIRRQRCGQRIEAALQMDEDVDGECVKRRLVGALGEQSRIGAVAEILQQQQAGCLVARQYGGRTQGEAVQHGGDRKEGADILLRRRRVHEDRAFSIERQALIAAERGVAGKRSALGMTPAGAGEKCDDHGGALSHWRRPARAARSSLPSLAASRPGLAARLRPPR
jgi:hypothetical protein